MLKKISHGFITLLFMAATTGITVSKHFCHDALAGVSVMLNASCDKAASCCSTDNLHVALCTDNSMDDGCCEDESDQIKVDIPFVNFNFQDDEQVYSVFAAITFGTFHSTTYQINRVLNPRFIPPIPKQSRQVLFQSFLC